MIEKKKAKVKVHIIKATGIWWLNLANRILLEKILPIDMLTWL